MLSHVEGVLRCPHCGAPVAVEPRVVACTGGHRFDVARQGYVNLATSHRHSASADTAAMVAARERFLAGGHFSPLTEAVADATAGVAVGETGVVADIGAGTGHHLAAVLERLPGWSGLAVDLSRYAARRAARAHERVGAIVCDVWEGLPVASGSVDVVLEVFAPRNVAEITRMLRRSGALVLATPAPDHLAELVDQLGLVHVDPGKHDRIAEAVSGVLRVADDRPVRWMMALCRADVAALARMGPSAHHIDEAHLQRAIDELEESVGVTAAVDVRVFRPA